MTIEKIILHHSGSVGSNPYTSSAHLTADDIEAAHKERWNFKSSLGKYAGYNFIYDPKTRQITQHRAIGEETAHTTGQNFCSIGICIIGNYNYDTGTPIDDLPPHARMDVINLLIDFCRGNFRDFVIAPDTQINLTPFRIYPHRFFKATDCYGRSILDNYFKEQVALRIYPKVGELQNTLQLLNEWLVRLKNQLTSLGAVGRECEGNIIINE